MQARPDVRDRYLRHFGMTDNELYTYLWSLRLAKMSEPKVVTVYSVPNSGAVKVHMQRLRKGERVFIDPNGKEALLARCGNPLAAGPTNRRNMALAAPSVEDSPMIAMKAMPDVSATPIAIIESRPEIAMVLPPDTIADVVSDIPPITTTVITAPPPAPPAPPPAGGGKNPFGILPFLGGGALIGIIVSHHGGGTPPVAPVPEPSTIVCLSAGALALLKRGRRS